MRSLNANDLRSLWLKFFQQKGHAVIPSASVIPENDPTVLFTTAGMHPLVPYLLGQKHPAGSSAAAGFPFPRRAFTLPGSLGGNPGKPFLRQGFL